MIRNKNLLILVLIPLLLGEAKAQAKDTLHLESLAQAIELLEGKHQGLEAARLRHQAALQMRHTAYELPRLELGGQYGNMGGAERDLMLEVKQSLPFPTVFGAKRRLLRIQSQQQGAQLALDKQELITVLRTLYEGIRYQEYRARTITQLDSTYADYVRLSELRHRSGVAKSSELRLSQLKRGKIAQQMSECLLTLEETSRQMASLLGHKGVVRIALDRELIPLKLPREVELNSLEHNAGLRLSSIRIEEARAERRHTKASLLPEITLGYENSSAVGMHEIGGREVWQGLGKRFSSYYLGLSIPLDLGTSRAKLRAERLEIQAREHAHEQLRSDLEAALCSAQEAYRMRLKQYEYYKYEAQPTAEEVLRVADRNFRSGEISYLEYLEALETMTEVRLSYLESCYQLSLAVIHIHSLTHL